ncbi:MULTISPECIES: M28 family peptidase [unclassified Lentimicrobium]|uniref:M28 family peptidase n=1 Tax=unclassified Lentimicrobium TaxID=2677434 RepID=UPI0015531A5A|nr:MULTISPECIES: M28 family peptidase [unclassified Lentimicrobium]NPD44091.1 M28 family peptidase [Lentimicrobium sp. S6]NPD86240.1 M28 family peptidase [Lentimicrobium sp. L6]
MKHISFLLICLFTGLFSFAQSHDSQIENVINTVNLDSLIYQMRNLSGEDEVIVNGETTTIEHRVSNWGNNLAAQYIFESLESLGLETTWDAYSLDGINVYAVQPGTVYPDEYYMICGHYDAVDYYCADDNASGTAAVIEAARILSTMEFEYSIIYALWDEEEIGLIGSADYAARAASNGDVIHSVINMDMISWDQDEDMVLEIHTSNTANSTQLADYIVEINDIYELDIVPVLELPGTVYSDHASFWNNDYAAVLIIEEYYGGDFNPYYHTEQDRIAILNMDYFFEASKLCIGSLASMCSPILNTSTVEMPKTENGKIEIFPNPAISNARINFYLEQNQYTEVSLLNNMGQTISTLHQGEMTSGIFQIELPLEGLSQGLYFVKIEATNFSNTEKLLVK